jgi:hypothetical protein
MKDRIETNRGIPIEALEALRVARGWGSHIFRHSATDVGKFFSSMRRPLFTLRKFMVLISVGGWVDPRAIVRLEGLDKLKKSTSSGTRTSNLPACNVVPQQTTLPLLSKIKWSLIQSRLCLLQCRHEPERRLFQWFVRLFNDALSSSECTASNDTIIIIMWKWFWPNFGYYPGI